MHLSKHFLPLLARAQQKRGFFAPAVYYNVRVRTRAYSYEYSILSSGFFLTLFPLTLSATYLASIV